MASKRNELERKIRSGGWTETFSISHVNLFYDYQFIDEDERDELLSIIASVFNS